MWVCFYFSEDTTIFQFILKCVFIRIWRSAIRITENMNAITIYFFCTGSGLKLYVLDPSMFVDMHWVRFRIDILWDSLNYPLFLRVSGWITELFWRCDMFFSFVSCLAEVYCSLFPAKLILNNRQCVVFFAKLKIW